MKAKRKSAAEIFQEQNVLLQDQVVLDEEAEMEEEMQMGRSMPATGAVDDFAASPPMPMPQAARRRKQMPLGGGLKTSEDLQLEKEPVQVRETGFGLWKRVIIPPNAYVVHTRMRRAKPVTLGLGVSFRYNPYTDAYLVVPAAMQTIGVVANCISKEKQGINILAYVQWQIDNFAVAYRKLDFSDSRDPLAIVNAQLREQAEAAIKDKISTMSVEEVLTDKAPIIEELTTRLKTVSEGRAQHDEMTDEGLGIKIVTVQIREALVSSERLWQHLQAPYRHEQEKQARISHLSMQDEIRQKELETRQATETREAETMVEIERIKQGKQTEAVEIRLVEDATRFTKQQETAQQKIQLEEQTTVARRESEQRLQAQAAEIEQEQTLRALQLEHDQELTQSRLETEAQNRQKSLQIEQALHQLTEDTRLDEIRVQSEEARLERETKLKEQETAFNLLAQEQESQLQAQVLAASLARQRDEQLAKLSLEEESNRVQLARLERELDLERLGQEIRNLINDRDLLSQFITQLPEMAAEMPEVHELKVLQTGGEAGFDTFSAFVAKMMALAESLGLSLSTASTNGTQGE